MLVIAAVAWPWWPTIPARWLPWAPLSIADEPTAFTGLKLIRLSGDPEACSAVLRAAAIEHQRIPDRQTGAGCGFMGAVRVSGGVTIGGTITATCPLVVAWALFERHALQPAAEAHLGSPVLRSDHLGTYACRNVYGRSEGRRSQHATANAIDIAGFTLRDGTRVSVLRDWSGGDVRKRAFLRATRDGACRFFRGVLGPDYNAAHRDHFHLDRGRYSVCR